MPHLDFCLEIAEQITSNFDQHVTMMITATTGAGKSWAGLSIAECVSQYVAEIKGGEPIDYFNIDNVAIITRDELMRVMSTKMDIKYSCLGFDDIGAYGWSSRDFMSDFSQALSSVYQTFRTKTNFVYLTVPNDALVDINARRLTKYTMDIVQSHFDEGYIIAKIFKPIVNSRLPHGKITPYLLDMDGLRIKRHIVFRPSIELSEEYKKRRQQIQSQAMNTSIDGMQQIITTDIISQEPRPSKKALLSPIIKKLYNNGKGLSMREISEYLSDENSEHKISTQTISEALKYNPTKTN